MRRSICTHFGFGNIHKHKHIHTQTHRHTRAKTQPAPFCMDFGHMVFVGASRLLRVVPQRTSVTLARTTQPPQQPLCGGAFSVVLTSDGVTVLVRHSNRLEPVTLFAFSLRVGLLFGCVVVWSPSN